MGGGYEIEEIDRLPRTSRFGCIKLAALNYIERHHGRSAIIADRKIGTLAAIHMKVGEHLNCLSQINEQVSSGGWLPRLDTNI